MAEYTVALTKTELGRFADLASAYDRARNQHDDHFRLAFVYCSVYPNNEGYDLYLEDEPKAPFDDVKLVGVLHFGYGTPIEDLLDQILEQDLLSQPRERALYDVLAPPGVQDEMRGVYLDPAKRPQSTLDVIESHLREAFLFFFENPYPYFNGWEGLFDLAYRLAIAEQRQGSYIFTWTQVGEQDGVRAFQCVMTREHSAEIITQVTHVLGAERNLANVKRTVEAHLLMEHAQ